MQRFAQGLEADLLAMRAAFSSPWSNGRVEGQINRLKYLRRQSVSATDCGKRGSHILKSHTSQPMMPTVRNASYRVCMMFLFERFYETSWCH